MKALTTILLFILTVASARSVYNQSPYQARYTYDADVASAPNLCAFWNWQNPRVFKRVRCTQRYLNSGGTATNSGMDGFTFAEREYYWAGILITRGEWTNIRGQSARCIDGSGGRPRCNYPGLPP